MGQAPSLGGAASDDSNKIKPSDKYPSVAHEVHTVWSAACEPYTQTHSQHPSPQLRAHTLTGSSHITYYHPGLLIAFTSRFIFSRVEYRAQQTPTLISSVNVSQCYCHRRLSLCQTRPTSRRADASNTGQQRFSAMSKFTLYPLSLISGPPSCRGARDQHRGHLPYRSTAMRNYQMFNAC